MKGWFDAFRDDGAPTLYFFSNRTPVIGDVSLIIVSILFATFYIAFLVIFPGVRKQKISTFITVTLSLFVGLVIFGFFKREITHTYWCTYWIDACEYYSSGLSENSTTQDIDFNERFNWNQANDMGNSYKDALKRGLPYPILTVAEYFSLGQEGFAWGGQYRAAGYYASIWLWASLASWLLMNLYLTAVPRYGAYGMCVTGSLLLGASIGYYLMLPKPPLTIFIEGARIEFNLGWCFYLVLIAGSLCFFIGLIIRQLILFGLMSIQQILEVYYDTPYDRHVILEESHDVRYRKRNSKGGLEEPASLGSRILRRLSSKTQHVPKSPWRYPFRRSQMPPMIRTVSQDSNSSIASAAANINNAGPSTSTHSLRREALARMLPPRPPIDRNKDKEKEKDKVPAIELTNW
ncbi:hypothetical protein PVAND_005434 [Polypedilum vanderplanki]|uniref:Dual oxidase maturation factor 1 n=1 Tax=Polypedilum vanderplanki TaxID=319348 RepID=A0A9J6C0L0_POLVA|nr:hypothetical protein PVAND_005434 [Polypedilum vanderplanki]